VLGSVLRVDQWQDGHHDEAVEESGFRALRGVLGVFVPSWAFRRGIGGGTGEGERKDREREKGEGEDERYREGEKEWVGQREGGREGDR
jgi:hypothetical protein